jgi:hypothetical protein
LYVAATQVSDEPKFIEDHVVPLYLSPLLDDVGRNEINPFPTDATNAEALPIVLASHVIPSVLCKLAPELDTATNSSFAYAKLDIVSVTITEDAVNNGSFTITLGSKLYLDVLSNVETIGRPGYIDSHPGVSSMSLLINATFVISSYDEIYPYCPIPAPAVMNIRCPAYNSFVPVTSAAAKIIETSSPPCAEFNRY